MLQLNRNQGCCNKPYTLNWNIILCMQEFISITQTTRIEGCKPRIYVHTSWKNRRLVSVSAHAPLTKDNTGRWRLDVMDTAITSSFIVTHESPLFCSAIFLFFGEQILKCPPCSYYEDYISSLCSPSRVIHP